MTVVRMSEKRQIVVPKSIRDERGFGNGSAFSVLETSNGAILFRPVKTAPKYVFLTQRPD
jgi:AbrB family looped-hinge helix DNA binding protein